MKSGGRSGEASTTGKRIGAVNWVEDRRRSKGVGVFLLKTFNRPSLTRALSEALLRLTGRWAPVSPQSHTHCLMTTRAHGRCPHQAEALHSSTPLCPSAKLERRRDVAGGRVVVPDQRCLNCRSGRTEPDHAVSIGRSSPSAECKLLCARGKCMVPCRRASFQM